MFDQMARVVGSSEQGALEQNVLCSPEGFVAAPVRVCALVEQGFDFFEVESGF